MEDDPQRLRARVVRLFAMALAAREINAEYADKLVAEAMELQDRASAIEEGTYLRSPSEAPTRPAQLQEQIPTKKEAD
jgi:hypothetical protein